MVRVWPVKLWGFCELSGLVYTPVWLVGGGIAKPSYVGSNPIHASEFLSGFRPVYGGPPPSRSKLRNTLP